MWIVHHGNMALGCHKKGNILWIDDKMDAVFIR